MFVQSGLYTWNQPSEMDEAGADNSPNLGGKIRNLCVVHPRCISNLKLLWKIVLEQVQRISGGRN